MKPTDPELAALHDLRTAHAAIRSELSKAIIGQADVIDQLLMCLLTGSHALLVGVPGLAKTLLISSLSQTLDLSFKRIQFTPDLMPSDITGTEVMYEDRESGKREFKFIKGPVFANVLLADEINRTPPKTQAALLEAMQEKRVSSGGTIHDLPKPFFVLATQNPLEQEGTYPLPEAQLDRFLFMIRVDYPSDAEEIAVMKLATGAPPEVPQPVLSGSEILRLQQLVRKIPVADHVLAYAQRIVALTRVSTPAAAEVCKRYVHWGAGPRASLGLVLAAKARAALAGRHHVSSEDIASVAVPVLRHRVILNFAAQSEGVTPDRVVAQVIESVPMNTPIK